MLTFTKQEATELVDNLLSSIITVDTTVSFDNLRELLTKQLSIYHTNLIIDEYETWL